MFRGHPARRRPRCPGPQLCAAAAALLLLLSLSVLHVRLSSSPFRLAFRAPAAASDTGAPLFDDANNDAFDGTTDDRIDELDNLEDEDDEARRRSEEDDDSDELDPLPRRSAAGGFFWDHVTGAARRSFGKPERDRVLVTASSDADESRPEYKIAFGSDDEPVDESVRVKLDSISRIEDVLLIKLASSGGGDTALREGWAHWLEGKADFLQRDRMLRSNLEQLNPRNHPLLQDPDGPGVSSLTRGDRLMQKALWMELEKTPLEGRRGGDGVKKADRRRTLDSKERKSPQEKVSLKEEARYADGRRWGYFPGLDPHLPFSEFVDQFLDDGRCALRVFMVWNSPSWMYGVRHQRGLESLLHHHSNACVLVFSEMMELDFFKDFVKEGFRIAVVMPNLDELLNDTPTHIFASVWFEWKKTKYYSIHYSELVRLAALYKFGGIYLDSDVIVLNALLTLNNSIGVENQIGRNSIYNGAVMSFQRHSPLLKECLEEFYMTYDDTRLTWNGAELMTRVINRLFDRENQSDVQVDIKVESPLAFFPINSQNITRYFVSASDELEKAQQDVLFRMIQNNSLTFHFWNSLTSALVPEPGSLAERLINQFCLHCLDML